MQLFTAHLDVTTTTLRERSIGNFFPNASAPLGDPFMSTIGAMSFTKTGASATPLVFAASPTSNTVMRAFANHVGPTADYVTTHGPVSCIRTNGTCATVVASTTAGSFAVRALVVSAATTL